jgi:hypothetical protein
MHSLLTYLVILIPATLIGIVYGLFKYRKITKVNKSLLALKDKGRKIVVQLEACELKSREYFDKEPSNHLPSQAEMLGALYDPNRS